MPRRYARYTTSDWASPSCPSPLSTAETTTTPPDVGCKPTCVCGRAVLKRWMRSLVKSCAMPESSVSCCGCVAAAPDEHAVAHSETNTVAIASRHRAPCRRRGRKRDDVVATDPLSRLPRRSARREGGRTKRDYTGTLRACPQSDDN